MFVLRSAFWLIVGFLLVAPHGTDFGASATALKDQAVEAGIEAGQQLIVSQITAGNRLPDLMIPRGDAHGPAGRSHPPPAAPGVTELSQGHASLPRRKLHPSVPWPLPQMRCPASAASLCAHALAIGGRAY